MKYVFWFIGLLVLIGLAMVVFKYTPRPNAVNNSTQDTEQVEIFLTRVTQTDMEFVPVKREVPKTNVIEDLIKETLQELIKGPTSAEAAQGLTVAFNQGTEVNYVRISGDTLTVDFNSRFDTPMGGSTRVSSIFQSIDRTVRQFPLEGVSDIKLTVNNGERAANLEP